MIEFVDEVHKAFCYNIVNRLIRKDVTEVSMIFLISMTEASRNAFCRFFNVDMGKVDPIDIRDAYKNESVFPLYRLSYHLFIAYCAIEEIRNNFPVGNLYIADATSRFNAEIKDKFNI